MEEISAMAGAILSLVFSYVPKVNEWFGKLDGTQKRLVMLVLLLAAVLIQLGLACAGLGADFELKATCNREGIVMLVRAFIMAAVANQTTYMLTPHTGKGPA